jgi:hypothetical protein
MTITEQDIEKEVNFYNTHAIQKAFKDILNKPVWVASNISKGKLPINPKTGGNAKANDPNTWGTFDEVLIYNQANPGHYPAIALSEKLGLVAIDLDRVHEIETGLTFPWASEIVKESGSYAEYSVSGQGLHIFVKGKKPGEQCKKGQFEIYDKSKFITVTGNILRGHEEIKPAQDFINRLYKDTFKEDLKVTEQQIEKSPPMSDEEIIKLIESANNREKFKQLYCEGETKQYTGDDSAADLALCSMLAFYTQDEEQLTRLLRKSKLKRPKWDSHASYVSITIKKALNNLMSTYQQKQTELDYTDVMDTLAKYSEIPDTPFPLHTLPACLKEAVYEVSRLNKVDPSLAALPGIGLFALQIGKKAVIQEKPGLTHYPSIFLCGVAESGERKSSTFERMTEGLKEAMTQAENQYKADFAKIKAHNEAIMEKIKDAKKALSKLEDVDSKEAEDLETTIGKLTLTIRPDIPEPQNYFDDITPQRIVQKLHVHKGAFGIISSEGRGILHRIMGKGSSDGSSQETVFLSGMWGDDIARSRVGNNKGEMGGEDTIIRKPALTTVCLVQPDVWKEVCKDSRLRASGFISRVQVVTIPSTIGNRIEDKNEVKCDQTKLQRYNQAIISLWKWKREDPLIVYLDERAQERRREFHNIIEKELRIGGSFEDVRDIASKAVSLTCRLALNFTMIKIADQRPLELNSIQEVYVSEEDWLNAQELQEYFLGQAIISQRENSKDGKTHKLIRAINWIKKHCPKGESFTTRDLARGLGRGTNSQESEELCKDLVKRELIKIAPNLTEKKNRTQSYIPEIGKLPCST